MLRCRFLIALAVLLCAHFSLAENLSPLAAKPNWSWLDRYQRTITHDQFLRLLNDVYATRGYDDLIQIDDNEARIRKEEGSDEFFVLHFANREPREQPAHFWKQLDIPSSRATRKRPLAGLQIALDPGHLGGQWAKMEERWMKVGEQPPIEEGEMTLRVAKILAPKLRALGAEVSFVRSKTEPTTPKRPDDFRELAKTILAKNGVEQPPENYAGPDDAAKERSIRWQSEILFYRQSEIRYRGKRVNEFLQPDVVLCLHFNAEEWGEPNNPTLIDRNHFHVLVNGSYLPDEIKYDDQRYEMTRRLLSRVYDEEAPLADAMAATFARETGLPPYVYTRDTVKKIGTSGYVYLRNLLASRVFRCPVVYFEPYVMNSHEGFERMQAGDYDGTRVFNGVARKSIYREYAQAVADGVAEFCRAKRMRR